MIRFQILALQLTAGSQFEVTDSVSSDRVGSKLPLQVRLFRQWSRLVHRLARMSEGKDTTT